MQEHNQKVTGRREFLSLLSAAAILNIIDTSGVKAMSVSENSTGLQTSLPDISLGKHKISRLICGSNPISGYSYLGPHTNNAMKEYFNPERTVKFLQDCKNAGITTHQCSSRYDYLVLLRELGTHLNIIRLDKGREKINDAIKQSEPIAISHHGGHTDTLFADGKSSVVHDYVKAVKDKGLLAGVSSHNPDVIKRIADEGWEVDFFMTCFYYLTRKIKNESEIKTLKVGEYQFYKEDPVRMTNVIRQVSQPCLAYKILGAGRYCNNQEEVKNAFKFAFENIKPIDGIIVGMFPMYFDEIKANAQYAKELG